MTRRWPRRLLAAALTAPLLTTAACGALPFTDADDQRYLDAGRELIEGDLADRIGLGALEADCDGHHLDPGDTFTCTAVSPGRRPILFVAMISADGRAVDLTTTNLLLADQVEQIETFAASLIAQDTALPIDNDHFECADNSVVVGTGETMDCLVTDPTDQTILAVSVTIDDLDTLSITVDVGEPVE